VVTKPRNSRFYLVKFRWKGKTIRKSSRATDKKTARVIEAQIRSELAKGNFGILEDQKPPVPTLGEFLQNDFMPFVEQKFSEKKKTREYYRYGVTSLVSAGIASVKLDEVTDQHAMRFASRKSHLEVSTVNCVLRTLRRAVNLACEWGRIEKQIKIRLKSGEKQRDRVLTAEEEQAYLAACALPWKDAATVFFGTGLRPSELFALRWEQLTFTSNSGSIRLLEGKTRNARRVLPMMPSVRQTLWSSIRRRVIPPRAGCFPPTRSVAILRRGQPNASTRRR
jgi:integrase